MRCLLLVLMLGIFAATAPAAPANAQKLLGFPRTDYGKATLSQPQSATGERFEVGIGSANFEPINSYGESSTFARVGRAVGRLDVLTNIGLFPCTASVISPTLVLTNHHCVNGLAEEARRMGHAGLHIQTISLLMGYVTDGVEEDALRFQVNPIPVEDSAELDYAILEVFGDPSSRFGTVKLASLDPLPDLHPFWVIGHPAGQALRISREQCRAGRPAISGGRLRHTCDTVGGNSGSPVIDADTRSAVALHHAGQLDAQINFAIPMARIAAASPLVSGLIDRKPTQPTAIAAPAEPPLSPAARDWAAIQGTSSCAILDAYLSAHGDGPFARYADARRMELKCGQTQIAARPQPAEPPPSSVAPVQRETPPASTAPDVSTSGNQVPEVLPPDIATDIASRVLPAVVSVVATVPGSENNKSATVQASGFVISPEGYIVSSQAVVREATAIHATLSDGTKHSATLIGSNAEINLALLKIDAGRDLPTLAFAGRPSPVDEHVLAFGSPFGLTGSVSLGRITRVAPVSEGAIISTTPHYLHTDAAILPGHDGAPLVDADGNVAGVLMARYGADPGTPASSAAGLPADKPLKKFFDNFPSTGPHNTPVVPEIDGSLERGLAVPADLAAAVLAELKESGEIANLQDVVAKVRAARTQTTAAPRHMRVELEQVAVARTRAASVSISVARAGAASEPAGSYFPDLPSDHPLNEFFKQFPKADGDGTGSATQAPSSQIRGGGTVISADGHIITNNHVIDGADSIQVRFADGREFQASVVGTDARTDLALLKVEDATGFQFVELNEATSPRPGSQLFMFDVSDLSAESPPWSMIVSSRGRDVGSGPYDYFQHDGRGIESRTSTGSGVFDRNGQLVGINTALFSPSGAASSTGISFAVPVGIAAAVAGQLRNSGEVRRGWLGVKIQAVDDDMAKAFGLPRAYGALVTEVTSDAPAERGGVKSGDAILTVDGTEIENSRDLARRIAEYAPGARVRLGLLRNKEKLDVDVTLGTFPTAVAANTAAEQPDPVVALRDKATNGDAAAMFDLARRLSEGNGVDQDDAGAQGWLKKSASLGHGPAMYELARMLHQGEGSARNETEAAAWLFAGLKARHNYTLEQMRDNPNAWNLATRKALQQLLKNDGHYSGAIDGNFGPGTKSAVQAAYDSGLKLVLTDELLGLSLTTLTPALRQQHSITSDVSGLLVTDVDTSSDAAEKGIAAGQVIVEINGTSVSTHADAAAQIAEARSAGRSAALLLVAQGNGDRRFVALRFK